ncbi:ParB-like partition protein [Oceanicola granulosus HTCC2516]|uniref:ParB-like partition protein n=1 Tax=Oceanicola granulosus (strain ATCC BAA-861 / DSM 15982 / KCTC 12143 / HTCC2516) TaxID=314256 RepID=Q2CHF7_OCEGH|nr:plasmid partitioning protein RepB [Oceanicola granulosus]EAR52082.1 ParB-like partition protein [Oceanicola granulosus HTCC2516]
MARKNVLQGLMKPAGGGGEGEPPAAPAPAQPRRRTGAIGAVSQSLADLKMRALVEVPADMIDDAGLRDRLDSDPAAHEELMRSLKTYGQQVPVMLRHSPNYEGRYDIVYGRRRVAALKALRMPVKAMIRDLDDRSLIVAQGQENAARRDLTFIEKANFARQMVRGGFDRKTVCDALHIDKTVVSRMLQVAEAVPLEVIEAIGAAPAAGRDRWLALAKRLDGRAPDEVVALARGETSDARFEALFAALAPESRRQPPAPPRELHDADGTLLARMGRKGARATLTLETGDGFDEWLAENFDRIYRDFRTERGR